MHEKYVITGDCPPRHTYEFQIFMWKCKFKCKCKSIVRGAKVVMYNNIKPAQYMNLHFHMKI